MILTPAAIKLPERLVAAPSTNSRFIYPIRLFGSPVRVVTFPTKTPPSRKIGYGGIRPVMTHSRCVVNGPTVRPAATPRSHGMAYL